MTKLPDLIHRATQNYTVAPLQADDPAISAAAYNYIKFWKLPGSAKPSAAVWNGVYDDKELLLVVGEKQVSADVLEVTDMYVVPGKGRKAIMAVYKTMITYKLLLEMGKIKKIIISVLFKNDSFRRAIERVFGIPPVAVIYVSSM
jgi:hypothetical protein